MGGSNPGVVADFKTIKVIMQIIIVIVIIIHIIIVTVVVVIRMIMRSPSGCPSRVQSSPGLGPPVSAASRRGRGEQGLHRRATATFPYVLLQAVFKRAPVAICCNILKYVEIGCHILVTFFHGRNRKHEFSEAKLHKQDIQLCQVKHAIHIWATFFHGSSLSRNRGHVFPWQFIKQESYVVTCWQRFSMAIYIYIYIYSIV